MAQRLADSGKQVIIAGLDTDYLGRPFAPIPDLLAHAESITKTLAICVRCGNPAKHTQRLRGCDDLIVVGASDMYEARCRRCFEPGIPKQTEMEFVKAKRQEKEFLSPRRRGDTEKDAEKTRWFILRAFSVPPRLRGDPALRFCRSPLAPGTASTTAPRSLWCRYRRGPQRGPCRTIAR